MLFKGSSKKLLPIFLFMAMFINLAPAAMLDCRRKNPAFDGKFKLSYQSNHAGKEVFLDILGKDCEHIGILYRETDRKDPNKKPEDASFLVEQVSTTDQVHIHWPDNWNFMLNPSIQVGSGRAKGNGNCGTDQDDHTECLVAFDAKK